MIKVKNEERRIGKKDWKRRIRKGKLEKRD